jgi:hypothetical protein
MKIFKFFQLKNNAKRMQIFYLNLDKNIFLNSVYIFKIKTFSIHFKQKLKILLYNAKH